MDSILESSVHEDGNSFSMNGCCHTKRECTYLRAKSIIKQNPSNLNHRSYRKASFYFFTGFYFSSISIEQLLDAMVVKKIVRSQSECNKQHDTPMFPTYHGHQKWPYGSDPQSPCPPKGIKRIQMKRSIECYQMGQLSRTETSEKQSKRQEKNATHMKQNVPT